MNNGNFVHTAFLRKKEHRPGSYYAFDEQARALCLASDF